MYLNDLYSKYDWFSSLEEKNNKIIFYVKYMNSDVLNIPDFFENKQVLVHFDKSKDVKKENFINYYNFDAELNEKLTALKVEFGSSVVENIFYEIHDGENKITFLSDLFPKLTEKMKLLYNEYGFSQIHNFFDYES